MPHLVAEVDQARARDAGVSSAVIAEALTRTVSSVPVTEFREGDDTIPITLRGEDAVRSDPVVRETPPIASANGGTVPLSQVASITVVNRFARIERQDFTRAITVEGKSSVMAAGNIAAHISQGLATIAASLPPGHAVQVVGVFQDSAESRSSLAVNFPLCFGRIALLFVTQFNSNRRALILGLIMPLVITGVALGLRVMGANFGFMLIVGILALFGIIFNNAIVLLDRIDLERKAGAEGVDAIVDACAQRLRPTTMTVITTVLGLLPLLIARDPLFFGFASVVASGLVVGSILTLGVLPILYSLLIETEERRANEESKSAPSEVLPPPIPELLAPMASKKTVKMCGESSFFC